MSVTTNRTAVSGSYGSRGFSLVEMMIALAVAVIVIGAVLSLTVNISQSSTALVGYSRLTQDMRTVVSVIQRDLRRAGHNVNAISQIRTGTTSAIHTRVLLDDPAGVDSCITYGFDTMDLGTSDSTPGVIDATEPTDWRGFRLNRVNGVGVVEMRAGGAGVGNSCAQGGHNWVALTDRASLNVLALDFDINNSAEAVAATVPDPADPTLTVTALIGIRTVQLTMRASSVSDPANVRELRELIRIRAESARLVAGP